MDTDLSFQAFWRNYPRKVGRQAAWRIWQRLKPDAQFLDRILTALEWQRVQPQWLKEQGQFIPHPATWLNQGRWDDQPVEIAEPDRTSWSDWKAAHLGKRH